MNKDNWQIHLESEEKRLGLNEGFKFVYGPWATLADREVAFLSLNPGKAPDGAEMRLVSDERGNSYEVERSVTKSPITDQFLRLAHFLDVLPIDILSGVVAPFRSDNWTGQTKLQRNEAFALGKQFWREPLSHPSLKLIFTCSNEATDLVCDLTDATFVKECLAAWGNTKLRRYETSTGAVIVHLPHLSRFKLFGRPDSEAAIRSIME